MSFLLSFTPPSLAPWAQTVWILVAIVMLAGNIVITMRLKRRPLPAYAAAPWRRLAHLLAATTAVLWVLLFFRSEGIPFLSARFWLALLSLTDAVWIAFILRQLLMTVPKQRAAAAAEEQKRKYLR